MVSSAQFESHFDAAEQKELMDEDTSALTNISMILTGLVAAGMTLAIGSVILIYWLFVARG